MARNRRGGPGELGGASGGPAPALGVGHTPTPLSVWLSRVTGGSARTGPRPTPRTCVCVQEDGLGPFAVKRPQVFVAADINLWNVLLFGLERVVNDAVSDTSACQCLIDSTFWLLTKQEQCSEISRALLALLNCAPITCV